MTSSTNNGHNGNNANAIMDDPVLKDYLQQLAYIDIDYDFQEWRTEFMSRYESFLNTAEFIPAKERYNRFRLCVTNLMKVILQLKMLFDQGELTTSTCSVKASKTLSDLSKEIKTVLMEQALLIPVTGPLEQACGYTKFHMGAILVRDDFSQYHRLNMCGRSLSHLRRLLMNVADQQVLHDMDQFVVRFKVFCDLMHELGIYAAMMKSRTLANVVVVFDFKDDEELVEMPRGGAGPVQCEICRGIGSHEEFCQNAPMVMFNPGDDDSVSTFSGMSFDSFSLSRPFENTTGPAGYRYRLGNNNKQFDTDNIVEGEEGEEDDNDDNDDDDLSQQVMGRDDDSESDSDTDTDDDDKVEKKKNDKGQAEKPKPSMVRRDSSFESESDEDDDSDSDDYSSSSSDEDDEDDEDEKVMMMKNKQPDNTIKKSSSHRNSDNNSMSMKKASSHRPIIPLDIPITATTDYPSASQQLPQKPPLLAPQPPGTMRPGGSVLRVNNDDDSYELDDSDSDSDSDDDKSAPNDKDEPRSSVPTRAVLDLAKEVRPSTYETKVPETSKIQPILPSLMRDDNDDNNSKDDSLILIPKEKQALPLVATAAAAAPPVKEQSKKAQTPSTTKGKVPITKLQPAVAAVAAPVVKEPFKKAQPPFTTTKKEDAPSVKEPFKKAQPPSTTATKKEEAPLVKEPTKKAQPPSTTTKKEAAPLVKEPFKKAQPPSSATKKEESPPVKEPTKKAQPLSSATTAQEKVPITKVQTSVFRRGRSFDSVEPAEHESESQSVHTASNMTTSSSSHHEKNDIKDRKIVEIKPSPIVVAEKVPTTKSNTRSLFRRGKSFDKEEDEEDSKNVMCNNKNYESLSDIPVDLATTPQRSSSLKSNPEEEAGVKESKEPQPEQPETEPVLEEQQLMRPSMFRGSSCHDISVNDNDKLEPESGSITSTTNTWTDTGVRPYRVTTIKINESPKVKPEPTKIEVDADHALQRKDALIHHQVPAETADQPKEIAESEDAPKKKTAPTCTLDKAMCRLYFKWYTRMGHPNRDTFKKKILALKAKNTDNLIPDVVDQLPWIRDGLMLDVGKMNRLVL